MMKSKAAAAAIGKPMPPLFLLLWIAVFLPTVAAYSSNSNLHSGAGQSRVEFFKSVLRSTGGVAAVSASQVILSHPQLANAAAVEQAEGKILRASGKCVYGIGEGCDDLSGDNDYIKELQRKSARNKEATEKEYLSAYQMKNYPDFFASLNPPKYMVKQPDGSIKLYEEEELTNLKKAGKIKLEKPTAMGGQVVDVTQKPIMVLKE